MGDEFPTVRNNERGRWVSNSVKQQKWELSFWQCITKKGEDKFITVYNNISGSLIFNSVYKKGGDELLTVYNNKKVVDDFQAV